MQNISFTRYVPGQADLGLTGQLVECYRDVFADGPWHEWLKCDICQKYWGKAHLSELASIGFEHCGKPLIDYWPRHQVMTDLRKQITPEASCWLAMEDGKIVGFCWGYPMHIDELEGELGVTFDPKPQISNAHVAYQDEVGVLASHRGHKLAKAMVAKRHEDFLAQNLELGIVRTREAPEPSTTFLWYTEKLGYRVIARYPDGDGRVILARDLAGLQHFLT